MLKVILLLSWCVNKMKLDKRILTGKKYLDCFDTDIAKEFIGEKCYFGGDNTNFEDISKLTCTMLYSVDNSTAPYNYYEDGIPHCTSFILPCAWVREPERKYRPYTLKEFVKEYSLGEELILKRINSSEKIRHALFLEYIEDNQEVRLGSYWYRFEELVNNYELYTGEGWKPFGIEV